MESGAAETESPPLRSGWEGLLNRIIPASLIQGKRLLGSELHSPPRIFVWGLFLVAIWNLRAFGLNVSYKIKVIPLNDCGDPQSQKCFL